MEPKILYLWRRITSFRRIGFGTVCRKYLLISPKNVIITFLSVMVWRVMFGKVICLVCGTFFQFNFELLLRLAVTKPIILHVPALGSLFSHGIMNKTCGSWVVCDNFCLSLWMSHAFQGIMNSDGYITVVENTSTFCFSHWRHYIL